MLLPRPSDDEEEEDPRAELVRRLQEYERYRKAAEALDSRPRVGRDIHIAIVDFSGKPAKHVQPTVNLSELLDSFKRVLERAQLYRHHHVLRERFSVRERMTQILARVHSEEFIRFEELFDIREGKLGLVVTFIAILELLKESLLVVVQQEPFAPIHIKVAA